MSNDQQSASPIAQLFEQSVVQGSALYWASHFSQEPNRAGVQATLCFAHEMNKLTSASAEVIAEKSVWWHEELNACHDASPRHPITQELLNAIPDNGSNRTELSSVLVDALHRHLHGALMSQQRTTIDSQESWEQYSAMRFGTLHEAFAIVCGLSAQQAQTLGAWTSKFHSLAILRASEHYQDSRVLSPSTTDQLGDPSQQLEALGEVPPHAPIASRVMIYHEQKWWKQTPTQASPLHTGLPVGLRGMLASWRVARRTA